MKVLILSCNTGEGHNSAAAAVNEYFSLCGDTCVTENALAFVSNNLSDLMSKGHVFVYRNMPKLFGAGYKIEEKYPPKAFYKAMAKGADNLHKYITENQYDAVICSHIFAAMILTECRKKLELKTPCYLITTDYTCSPGVNMLDLDAVFIAHETLKSEFIEKGVNCPLIASGIPIAQKFFSDTPRKESRESIGISPDSNMVLLSCGSMGCGPIHDLTESLLESLHHSTELCVVCGNNKKLYAELEPFTANSRLHLTGFTDKMYDYINAADVYITKPGGLSTTEAITVGVPLVFVDAVPGCESYNLDIMTESGCAVTAPDVNGLVKVVCDILKDKETSRLAYSSNQKRFVKNGAVCIRNFINNEKNTD